MNGDEYEVLVKPNRTLLELIRAELNLTGAKGACDEEQFGACTVIMEGKQEANRPHFY